MKIQPHCSAVCLLSLLLLAGCAAALSGDAPGSWRWLRGNTHTHTYWSDGDAPPDLVAARYRDAGYHFLVLSDHNVLSQGERWWPISNSGGRPLRDEHLEQIEKRFGPGWLVTREVEGGGEMRLKTLEEVRGALEEEGRFLMIEGEEVTDRYQGHEVHINAVNIGEVIPPQRGGSVAETIERNLDAILEQGRRLGRPVLAHLNHPNFVWSITVDDLASIRGERFFEIYNGHRGTNNNGDASHPSLEVMWDEANTRRITTLRLPLLHGLATDDSHNHHAGDLVSSEGRGWVMVRARELSAESVISALRAGEFYASSGVSIADFGFQEGRYWLVIEGEEGVTYETRFIGTRSDGVETGPPGILLEKSLSLRPEYRLGGDELFLRAVVISSKLHPDPHARGDFESAWLPPQRGPAAP
ncbi:MAG TPA: hypothetical protein EYN79_01705 [Planctomycetes bacterium]|nr:hypothetical protein [Planctomycetota bacterium]HIN79585.1 hypothetical protein [Planctomycetota bacterium]